MSMSTIKNGSISFYSQNQGRGEILLEDGKQIVFTAGTFDSGWPVRPPRQNDIVRVGLDDFNALLYVRLGPQKTQERSS